MVATGRTNESARKSHITNRPILPTLSLTAVVPRDRGQSWFMQASVNTVGFGRQLSPDNIQRCASTSGRSIHTNTMQHSHCFIARWSQNQISSGSVNSIKMATFSRRLAPRLARWVCHLCNRCFSHLCYKWFLCWINFLLWFIQNH